MTGTIRYWIQETKGAEVHSGGMPFSINEVNGPILAFMNMRALELAKHKH